MKRITAVAFLVALTALPVAAHAQDRYRSNVRGQSFGAQMIALLAGYGAPDRYEGNLNDGRVQFINVTLNSAQQEYILVGLCDNDCSDLDLEFYDARGNRLAYDHAPDSMPTIRIPRGYSGTYSLKVTMENCSAGPCRYEVGLYSK